MNYARYSKQALDALPPGSAELKRRVVELAVDVKLELHAAIAAKFREIVASINSLGHDLRETSKSKEGEIDFAQGADPCLFYLCCDTTISSGFHGTSGIHATPEEQEKWQEEWACFREKTQAEPDGPANPDSASLRRDR